MQQGQPRSYDKQMQTVDPRVIQELVRRQQASGQPSFVEVLAKMASMGIPINLKLGK